MYNVAINRGPRCPNCGQLDRVEKVTAIVQGGTQITNTSGSASVPMPYDPADPASLFPATSTYSSTHVHKSLLAMRLAAPVHPSAPTAPDTSPKLRAAAPLGLALTSGLCLAIF